MIHSLRAVGIVILSFSLLACDHGKDTAKISADADAFALNERDYFQNRGVGVMAFHDTAPESHQRGVIIVMHGTRIASNGDLRLEPTPGQWSPTPKVLSRHVDREAGEIRTRLAYPDENQHHTGFNPLHYPDLELTHDVRMRAEGNAIKVSVDLDKPLKLILERRVKYWRPFSEGQIRIERQ
ncbi:hypothetical protein [Microbulbifer rhizosphaerae]|uniref:Uncharacterized protein n=1 Tax=Microbulbifer rhizosphaerae TaxID=1562603 RepID=A0A7W4WA51_9GAMM|nr:hypothetical protein [Microbulbifer rhizosphaerae]MBB3059948.1 hypothetical protein [Microbulbifer rhizosphaerae]